MPPPSDPFDIDNLGHHVAAEDGLAGRPMIPVLSLWPPWAVLVAEGPKAVETRSWEAYAGSIGGEIAIASTASCPPACREALKAMGGWNPVFDALRSIGYEIAFNKSKLEHNLPCGQILSVHRLAGCFPTSKIHWGGDDAPVVERDGHLFIGSYEALYGDYSPGRFGWWLTERMKLASPVPWKGAQGLSKGISRSELHR